MTVLNMIPLFVTCAYGGMLLGLGVGWLMCAVVDSSAAHADRVCEEYLKEIA